MHKADDDDEKIVMTIGMMIGMMMIEILRSWKQVMHTADLKRRSQLWSAVHSLSLCQFLPSLPFIGNDLGQYNDQMVKSKSITDNGNSLGIR